MKSNSHNLITYYKAFYILGLHTAFKPDQQPIFWALLYKFNSLLYPDKIRISNRELANLTNIPLRTLFRYRDIWNEYRHLDTEESWIIKYESGKTRDYGIFQMNFEFLDGLMPKLLENGINGDDTDQSANGLMPKTIDFAEEMKIRGKKNVTNLQNGIENGTPSYTMLDNTILDNTTFPLNSTDPDNGKAEKQKTEDVLSQQEKAEDLVQVLEDTTLRWVNKLFGEEHCHKYPDETRRREIAKIKEKGCSSITIKNTVLHWKQEIKYPSKLDEFVLNSLEAQMQKGKAFYD